MPKQSHRATLWRAIRKRNPVLDLISGRAPDLTYEQYLAFAANISAGLVDRIRKSHPNEAEALTQAIEELQTRFPNEIRVQGLNKAQEEVYRVISHANIPMLKSLAKPSCLQLAEEASELQTHLPSRKEHKKREQWVERQGLDPHDAVETDAILIESLLAKRHSISPSQIHKLLAQARQHTR